MPNPYLQDADFTLYNGDALAVLRDLPSESVHCCVTSPPFFGLRDYQTEGQIGLEPTPEEWVARLVEVFREVRRVLRKDGTLWVEVGDSYTSAYACARRNVVGEGSPAADVNRPNRLVGGLKEKDLIGAPWLLAFALRADGWYLRSDIVWARPNPMPESVTDRPTKSHSYVFLFSRSPRYFFDQEAVRESNSLTTLAAWGNSHPRTGAVGSAPDRNDHNPDYSGAKMCGVNPAGRNIRSVWTIPTEPLPDEHYAAFPTALVEPCIKAGSPKGGTVLDPFLGSGTTAVVARRLGRKCIGVELSERYCGIGARRYARWWAKPSRPQAADPDQLSLDA